MAVAAGRDDTLPMLTGIRVEISGEKVVLAATDRFRLAVRELTWSTNAADVEAAVLVPAKTLAEAAKAGTGAGDVHLSLGAGAAVGKDGLLGIRSDGKRSTTPAARCRVPEVPSVASGRTHGCRHDRRRRADRGDQARRAGGGPRCTGSDGVRRRTRCKLSAGADDVGRAEEDLPVEFAGEPLTIAFNPTYLTDGLGSLHSRTCDVRLHDTQPSRGVASGGRRWGRHCRAGPARFPAAQTDYVYLLMPVRLPG